jgi:hypothetical protein
VEVFPSIEDLRTWADRLEEVQEQLAPFFELAAPRQRTMAYLRGLLSVTERKNGWPLAELAGEATPDGMLTGRNSRSDGRRQASQRRGARLLPNRPRPKRCWHERLPTG